MTRNERIAAYFTWGEYKVTHETRRALADKLIAGIFGAPLVGELSGSASPRGSDIEYSILMDGYQRAIERRK